MGVTGAFSDVIGDLPDVRDDVLNFSDDGADLPAHTIEAVCELSYFIIAFNLHV